MTKKGTYKIVTVVEVVKAPSEYSGRIREYERLSCGHYHTKPEIRESAKAIRALFVAISGEPQTRRCHQCVSGKPTVPAISAAWLRDNTPAGGEMTAHCPHCGKPITASEAASLMRAAKLTDLQREAARANGAKGGRPPGSKNKPKGSA